LFHRSPNTDPGGNGSKVVGQIDLPLSFLMTCVFSGG